MRSQQNAISLVQPRPFAVMRVCVLALLVGAIAHGGEAQSSDTVPQLDPRVYEVATGGQWNAGGQTGSFRVVVLQEGFEEIKYSAFLQWLDEATRTRPAKVVATQNLGTLAGRCFSLVSPVIGL